LLETYVKFAKTSIEYIYENISILTNFESIPKPTLEKKDFLHKVSMKLINKNQVITIESLIVKGMIRNKKLSKHITNTSWGEFSTLLNYKGNIKTLDKFFPSSKMCNNCEYILPFSAVG